MANLTNSHSLSEFQLNAEGMLEGLNQSRDPLLLTVNGEVQAVLIDPRTFQEIEEFIDSERLLAAILEGEQDIQAGRTRAVEHAFADLKAKYGL